MSKLSWTDIKSLALDAEDVNSEYILKRVKDRSEYIAFVNNSENPSRVYDISGGAIIDDIAPGDDAFIEFKRMVGENYWQDLEYYGSKWVVVYRHNFEVLAKQRAEEISSIDPVVDNADDISNTRLTWNQLVNLSLSLENIKSENALEDVFKGDGKYLAFYNPGYDSRYRLEDAIRVSKVSPNDDICIHIYAAASISGWLTTFEYRKYWVIVERSRFIDAIEATTILNNNGLGLNPYVSISNQLDELHTRADELLAKVNTSIAQSSSSNSINSNNSDLVNVDKVYQEGNKNMSNMSNTFAAQARPLRRVVTILLMDNDPGLDVEHSVVARYDNIVTEDDNATTVQELLANKLISRKIAAHNEIRATQTNLEILNRTGLATPLQPVKLRQLTWVVKDN